MVHGSIVFFFYFFFCFKFVVCMDTDFRLGTEGLPSSEGWRYFLTASFFCCSLVFLWVRIFSGNTAETQRINVDPYMLPGKVNPNYASNYRQIAVRSSYLSSWYSNWWHGLLIASFDILGEATMVWLRKKKEQKIKTATLHWSGFRPCTFLHVAWTEDYHLLRNVSISCDECRRQAEKVTKR